MISVRSVALKGNKWKTTFAGRSPCGRTPPFE